jgi:hypothetical protein
MTQEEREAERRWVLKMVALEEELGELPPGGASGVGPRARLKALGKAAPSAAMRSRERMRFLARALSALEEQAA